MKSYVTTNCQMSMVCGLCTKRTMSDELRKVSKETIVAYFKVLSMYMRGGNEETSGRHPRHESLPLELQWKVLSPGIKKAFLRPRGM